MARSEQTSAMMAPRAALRFGVGVALVTLIADQLHKWWMLSVVGIKSNERMIITPFMDFVYVINKGISYGLFAQGSDAGQYLLSAFALIVAIGLVIWLARGRHGWISALGVGLIAGGAIGNGIDRLHLGGVADFIQLHAFGFYWYVFNIADVAIVVGVVALLYDSVIASRKGAAKAS